MNVRVLSVLDGDVEYRCEETTSHVGPPCDGATTVTRTKWFNSKGGKLDTEVAERLLRAKMVVDEERALVARLFPGPRYTDL